MNKEKILELADRLERISYENAFDMSEFFHPCGSPSCIAGFALDGKGMTNDSHTPEQICAIAGIELGLTWYQANALFCPAYSYADSGAQEGEEGYISKERAIRCLRYLARSGDVDWANVR